MPDTIDLTTSTSDLVSWFQVEFPHLVKTMCASTHHYDETTINPYHIEGSIFTHTMMVCLQAQNFVPENGYVRWSTLLHDIGKPLARKVNEEKQRVNFIGHEGISAFLSLDVMNKSSLSVDDKVLIFKIIALHGSLFNFIKSDGSVKYELLETFKNEKTLLHHLLYQVKADAAGRFWKEGTASAISNVAFDNVKNVVDQLVDNTPIMQIDDNPQLIILCGPPCSGKSTEREKILLSHPGMVVISRDDLVEQVVVKYNLSGYNEAFNFLNENKEIEKNEVSNLIESLTLDAKQHNKSVLVDMTMMSKKRRRSWINTFPSNYKKHGIL
jgi:putative nucleotidyltransferase with HDIG domain